MIPPLTRPMARSSGPASAASKMPSNVPSGARTSRPYAPGSAGRMPETRDRRRCPAPFSQQAGQGLGGEKRRIAVEDKDLLDAALRREMALQPLTLSALSH